MTDLIERLRDQQTKFMTPILGEAADEIERLRYDLEELQDEFNSHQEKLSNDFDTDLWVAVRKLLNKTEFDWSGTDPDGVTAEQAYEWLYEALERRETTEI